jgi:multiple antibiotic resistance protein
MNDATFSLHSLLHAALVLFAMVNAVGNLPIFADFTSSMTPAERGRTFRVAVLVGSSIVLGFSFLGNWMLGSVFQVDTAAFKIAGGVLVFAVAARGMVLGSRNAAPSQGTDSDNVAVFPMGFPFLAGPGTIVTTILLMQSRGHLVTAVAAVLVYLAILPLLYLAPFIQRAIGKVGVMVISRILYIFIAAKAVAFILTGLRASFGLAP